MITTAVSKSERLKKAAKLQKLARLKFQQKRNREETENESTLIMIKRTRITTESGKNCISQKKLSPEKSNQNFEENIPSQETEKLLDKSKINQLKLFPVFTNFNSKSKQNPEVTKSCDSKGGQKRRVYKAKRRLSSSESAKKSQGNNKSKQGSILAFLAGGGVRKK